MDPELVTKLAGLPLQLQVIAAAGYCAYRLAYLGIGHSHRATDTIFSSLAFGLVAAIAMLASARWGIVASAACGIVMAIMSGVVWRLWLRHGLRNLMRKTGYSWSDDTVSAWDHLHEYNRTGPTQLTVELDDGTSLFCSDAGRLEDLPFGPYVLGSAGDVLMYADSSETPDGQFNNVDGVFDPEWGNLVTYIPKDRIRRIAIRYK